MSGADFIECPTVIGALFDTNSLKKVYESDKSELFYDTNSVIKVGDAVQLLTYNK